MQAKVGPGKFQWNAGAWFGGIIGSSCWMLSFAGLLFYANESALAWLPLLAFVFAVVLVWQFWRRRDRMEPFAAYIAVFGYLSAVFPLVWFVVQGSLTPEARELSRIPDASLANGVLVSTAVPVIAMLFAIVERSNAKRVRAMQEGSSNA